MVSKNRAKFVTFASIFLLLAFVLSSCSGSKTELNLANVEDGAATGAIDVALAAEGQSPLESTVQYELVTGFSNGRMGFMGVGGSIDGIFNPTLQVEPGDVVEITLVNGDALEHDIVLPDFNASSASIRAKGESTVIVFEAGQTGDFVYYCSIPGHRQAGMEGRLVVSEASAEAPSSAPSIVRAATDLPGPLSVTTPQHHSINIETVELVGQLANGVTYTYWTFDELVPGPFLRVQAGDTVDIILKNREDSLFTHSIDLHAVNGPGGGAAVTQVAPGEEKSFTFKALNPGLYVYHCATPMVAHHIASGMYGLILVEPVGGLLPVEREFYVMQGEIYTDSPLGTPGHQNVSIEKLMDETPEYFVFNGSSGALMEENALQAEVGDTVRIYFGVGGPNFTSSFHVIGEIFDQVYDQASLTSPPLTDVQTTLVPAGGATIVEFTVDYPGNYLLVDHALSRAERGLVGALVVTGDADSEIFFSTEEHSAGH
jgi:nitrite reductase (NO-forming)